MKTEYIRVDTVMILCMLIFMADHAWKAALTVNGALRWTGMILAALCFVGWVILFGLSIERLDVTQHQ